MSPDTPGPKSGFRSYLRLLRIPGAPGLAGWGVVGRFPIAMRSIGCLMMVAAVTGSLTDAGVVAAVMLVATGVTSPVLGRLADRRGQRGVLLATCAGHAVAMTALLLSIGLGAPLWLMVVTSVAVGCTSLSFSSFVRARWATLAKDDLLRTAYALESVLDEAIFLLGPLLVTALAAGVDPAAGLIACVLLTTAGSIAVALHHRSEPPRAPVDGHGTSRAIAVTGVRVLMACYAGMGFLLGALDVTMIGFAREQGSPGLAGVFLSLTAVGSLIAGVVYGAVDWRLSQARLLSLTAGVLAVGAVPLVFATSSWAMAGFAVVAGVAIAPALIAGSTLLESLAPKGTLSEGFSWLNSAGALGIALGTAAGGRLAEVDGSSLAAWAAVGGGVVAVAVSLAGQAALRRRRPAEESAPRMAVREQ